MCTIPSFLVIGCLLARIERGYSAEPDFPNLLSLRRDLRELEQRTKPIVGPGASVEASPYGPGEYERVIRVGSTNRRYELHVPPGYTKTRAIPLVVNFHGGGGRGATARLESRMDEKADRAGFIVVYPDGSGVSQERFLTWNAGSCCGYAVEHRVDDVAFVRALLDDVARLFAIDSNRIYATGLSNGAMMANRLACELSDRIAAIGTIAGTLGLDRCAPGRPISIMHFHGTADQNSPYQGGVGPHSAAKVSFRSVASHIEGWVRRDNCDPVPVERVNRDKATIVTYRAKDGTEVILATIEGMGHTWPKGRRMVKASVVGAINEDIPANEMMWEFFQRHPLK